MELQGPQQTLHRGCLCEGLWREASFPAPGRGPASVSARSSSPGAWGSWSEPSLAGKCCSGGPAPAPVAAACCVRGQIQSGGAGTQPSTPYPGEVPTCPEALGLACCRLPCRHRFVPRTQLAAGVTTVAQGPEVTYWGRAATR